MCKEWNLFVDAVSSGETPDSVMLSAQLLERSAGLSNDARKVLNAKPKIHKNEHIIDAGNGRFAQYSREPWSRIESSGVAHNAAARFFSPEFLARCNVDDVRNSYLATTLYLAQDPKRILTETVNAIRASQLLTPKAMAFMVVRFMTVSGMKGFFKAIDPDYPDGEVNAYSRWKYLHAISRMVGEVKFWIGNLVDDREWRNDMISCRKEFRPCFDAMMQYDLGSSADASMVFFEKLAQISKRKLGEYTDFNGDGPLLCTLTRPLGELYRASKHRGKFIYPGLVRGYVAAGGDPMKKNCWGLRWKDLWEAVVADWESGVAA